MIVRVLWRMMVGANSPNTSNTLAVFDAIVLFIMCKLSLATCSKCLGRCIWSSWNSVFCLNQLFRDGSLALVTTLQKTYSHPGIEALLSIIKTLLPLSLDSGLTCPLVTILHKTYSHPGIETLLSIIKTLLPLSLDSGLTCPLVTILHKTYSHPGIEALLSIIKTLLPLSLDSGLTCPLVTILQKTYSHPGIEALLSIITDSYHIRLHNSFYKTRIDFMLPFYIQNDHTRKSVIMKSYACLFVYLTTAAVHLELCSELLTLEFLLHSNNLPPEGKLQHTSILTTEQIFKEPTRKFGNCSNSNYPSKCIFCVPLLHCFQHTMASHSALSTLFWRFVGSRGQRKEDTTAKNSYLLITFT